MRSYTSSDPQITVGERVGATLAECGVTRAFGVVGSGNYLASAGLLAHGAIFTAARHEGAAITMADAYTRASGEISVCSVHQGPGLTNTITGLVDAVKNRTPLVMIAGQTSAGATHSTFYIDQRALVESVGAGYEEVYRAESARDDTMRAYRRALSERRPIVLGMPVDIQAERETTSVVAPPRPVPSRPAPSAAAVRELIGVLRFARRPLFVAGRGAMLSGSNHAILRLAEKLGALVATSAMANGYFGEDQWSLGIAGGFSSDDTAAVMAEADVVIGFGCSFTVWTTRHGTLFAADAKVAQVDLDGAALGRWDGVRLSVLGDCNATADALLAEIVDEPSSSKWRTPETLSRLRDLKTPRTVVGPYTEGVVHPQAFTQALAALLPVERTLVVDGGHFIGWPIADIAVTDPRRFIFSSGGFQSIGLGLAAAVGAHATHPGQVTVLATGDGGFLMGISELETLVRLKLTVLVVVYNDSAYSAEVHHFNPGEDTSALVRFPTSDLAALAHGAGASGVVIRDIADLDQIRSWIANPSGPMIVDARIDPSVVGWWSEGTFHGH